MAKLEKIKRRGVKWILGELDFHYKYNDLEYLSKLKALDLLSLECKFRLTDLILFHDIVYNISTINLPDYIIQADNEAIAANNNTLRQYINPPLYPAGYSLEFDLESKRAKSKLDSLSFNIMIDISVNVFNCLRTHFLYDLLYNDTNSQLLNYVKSSARMGLNLL